jgi:hypothetical protein
VKQHPKEESSRKEIKNDDEKKETFLAFVTCRSIEVLMNNFWLPLERVEFLRNEIEKTGRVCPVENRLGEVSVDPFPAIEYISNSPLGEKQRRTEKSC